MTTVNRYILKSFLVNFITYFCITTFLLLLSYLYQIVNSLIVHKTDFIIATKLFLLLTPSAFSLTIPIALLISVLLTFSLLSETKELLTIQTMGIRKSFYTVNFLFLAMFLTVLLFYFNTIFVPKSYKSFKRTFINYVLLKPTIDFSNNLISIKNKKILYQKVEKQNNKVVLYKVCIYDLIKGSDIIQTIYAKNADVFSDVKGNIIFYLENGKIMIFAKTKPTQLTYLSFDKYKFIVYSDEINKIVTDTVNLRELTNKELLSEYKKTDIINYKKYILSEYFLRYSISMSLFVFTIIGIIVGTKIKKNAKPLSFIFSIVFILLYYFLLIGCISVVENSSLPPNFLIAAIIMQIPNIFSLVLAFLISFILT